MDDLVIEAARFFELDEQTLEPLAGGNSNGVLYKGRHAGGACRVLKLFPPLCGEVAGAFEGLEYLETLSNDTPCEISFATPRRSRRNWEPSR